MFEFLDREQKERMVVLLVLVFFLVSWQQKAMAFRVYNLSNAVTVLDATTLQLVLDHAWTTMEPGLIIQLRIPATTPGSSDQLYACQDGTRIPNRLQPWSPTNMKTSRRFYDQLAAVLIHHPARALVDHLALSWTADADDDEWRHPVDKGTCWYSAAAQQSFSNFLEQQKKKTNSTTLPPPPQIPGANVPSDSGEAATYWQHVDDWYQQSLLLFGRAQLNMAVAAFQPLGLQLLVRFPAFPFLNPHWAFVGGYGVGMDPGVFNVSSTSSSADVDKYLPTLDKFFAIVQETGAHSILLPGIDQLFASPTMAWGDAVQWAQNRHLQVFTSFRTHLVQTQEHWQQVHSLMQLHDIVGFIADTPDEAVQAHQYLQPFARSYQNPYRARKWTPIRIAATTTTGLAVTFAPSSSSLLLKIPFQLMIPDNIQVTDLWLVNYNFQFFLQATWSTPLFPLGTSDLGNIGIENLDPTKKWWAWTGLVDCDFLAPSRKFQARFNVSNAAMDDDIYELPCGGAQVLDLSAHTLRFDA